MLKKQRKQQQYQERVRGPSQRTVLLQRRTGWVDKHDMGLQRSGIKENGRCDTQGRTSYSWTMVSGTRLFKEYYAYSIDVCKRWAYPFGRVSINVIEMGASLKMRILIFGRYGPTPLQGYSLMYLRWAHP